MNISHEQLTEYSSFEAAFISENSAIEPSQQPKKRGRKKIEFTFAECIQIVRFYILTRLNIKNITQIVPFAAQSTIRAKLEELLGPECYWYHVNEKFPLRLQSSSGSDQSIWVNLRRTWPTSSRARVETRLRAVKDSQPRLAEILRADTSPVHIWNRDFPPNGNADSRISMSSRASTTVPSPVPTLTDQSTITLQSLEDSPSKLVCSPFDLRSALSAIASCEADPSPDDQSWPIICDSMLSGDVDMEDMENTLLHDWSLTKIPTGMDAAGNDRPAAAVPSAELGHNPTPTGLPSMDRSPVFEDIKSQSMNPKRHSRMSNLFMATHRTFKRHLTAGSAKTLSSSALSQLRSVAQISIADSRSTSVVRYSIDTIEAFPVTQHLDSMDNRHQRAMRRLDLTRAALTRLYPRSLSSRMITPAEEKAFNSTFRSEIIEPNMRRTNPLWRWCCDPVETAWCRSNASSEGGFVLPCCTFCGLTPNHYAAASINGSLTNAIVLEEQGTVTELCGATDELWRAADALGNTPLFFVANRSSGILEGLKSVLQHLSCWKGAYLAHKNNNMQNFLFALNPFGMGAHCQYLQDILIFVVSQQASPDLSHRDVHGQTFLHCLVHHPDFNPNARTIRKLQDLVTSFRIKDCIDNLGRTFSQVIRTHKPEMISWSTWATTALRLDPHEVSLYDSLGHIRHPTEMDKHGNTALLYMTKNSDQFNNDDSGLFSALMDNVLTCSPLSIHFVDRLGESALFVAVKTGKPRIVRRLLQTPGIRYNIENYSAVSLLSAARDELRIAEQEASPTSLLKYCDILVCMIFVLDFDAGIPLPPPSHVFRSEEHLGTIMEEDLSLDAVLPSAY